MPAVAMAKHMLKCSDKPAEAPQPRPSPHLQSPESTHGQRATNRIAVARVSKPTSRTTSTTLAHLSGATFDSINMHPALHRSIKEVFEYSMMTQVQEAAIQVCISGGDVIAKAKTGTGKTLAFLIPALHTVLCKHGEGIQVLVISPTRELATQTAEEAKNLLRFLPQHKVMTVLGGTNMSVETASFQTKAPLVLVATPGRLDDHLHSGLAPMMNVRVLVFDEADQLLDQGFRPAIEKILKCLHTDRQTLLFSATFPTQLQTISRVAMKTPQIIDCIGEESTNEQVKQAVLMCTLEDLFGMVVSVLQDVTREPHKVIVFLPTTRETGFLAGLFGCMQFKTKILEIHSRKTQAQRTKISEEFRSLENGVLFSSDVSARGMDYPDVTFVLQVGAPTDRAQYLHRLGRTARAGRDGAGLLMLCDIEEYFLKYISDLPLEQWPHPSDVALSQAKAQVACTLPLLHQKEPQIGGQTYKAWLGQKKSYLSKLKWSAVELVEWANYFATDVLGLPEVPALEPKTVGMMGLKGVPGIVVKGKHR